MTSSIIRCAAVVLAACATPVTAGSSTAFEFGLVGDQPYDSRNEAEFAAVMKSLDAADLAFVVHDGDFWWDGGSWTEQAGGYPPCSDEAFAHRLTLAQGSKHPFVFVPGDNDWADCHRAKPRTYDPFERLAKLRKMFYPDDQSLGRRKMGLTRQSEDARYGAFRENVRWTRGGVLFVTLHVLGSNNNFGRTPQMDAEHAQRMAANLAWLAQAFDVAVRDRASGVMIIAQGNPHFQTTWPADLQRRYFLGGLALEAPRSRTPNGFDALLGAFEKHALAFGKPIVYVHGDTHLFRIDKPLVGSKSGRIIQNFTRVETFGHPEAHWVRATVDPRDPGVFTFRDEIVVDNLVKH